MYPLGIQLFSLDDQLKNDFIGTLKSVANIGYSFVELSDLYGFTADHVKNILNSLNLTCLSLHSDYYTALSKDLTAVIKTATTLECKYVVIPITWDDERPGGKNFQKAAKDFYHIAIELEKYNLKLLFHNHFFEFYTIEDKTALEYLFDSVPNGLLRPELDLAWISYADENPIKYIKLFNGKTEIVHIKDYKYDQNNELVLTPVGYGNKIYYPDVITSALECKIPYFVVEQDNSKERDALVAAEMSFKYIQNLLS